MIIFLAIILITELCSLTYQLNDCSIPNIVRAALFGDGAAAIMLVGNEHPLSSLSRFKILKSKSYFYPDTEHYMGWKMVESGFEIELSPEIPNLIIEKAGIDVSEFIIECGKIRQDIKFFVAHPGGPKVLNALIESINGTVDDFNLSFESLSEHGNMSSVSVIDVLSKTINKKDLVQGDLGLLLSTGPAFSLDLTLVQKC
jgi:alkylresorcinol/alkylpyrone synthase